MKIFNPFDNLHLSEKNQIWILPLMIILFSLFAIFTQYTIISSWMLYIVPFNITSFFEKPQYAFYSKIVIAVIVLTSIIRVFFVYYDFSRYNNRLGNKISANYLYFVFSGNLYFILLFFLMAYLIAVLVYLFSGWNINDVFEIITAESEKIKGLFYSTPNLINLPGYFAAIIIFLIWSLFQYGRHYLGHVSRIYWLLSHRPHHVTTAVTNGTGFLADNPFALSWIFTILEVIIVITVSKLITQEQGTVMVMFFVYAILYQFVEVFNHAPTFYKTIKNNKVLNFICKTFAGGPYHVLHHSSHEDHTMVNLGGNTGIWDFVFGTYHDLPEEEPVFGLTNQPTIELSASALTLSGIKQILFELKHNKDLKTRFKIIFGNIYYKPPITKDFLLIEGGGFNVLLHQINNN